MVYSIHLISNKPEVLEPIKNSLLPETVSYFDGTGFPSFSKLVNSCVAAAPTETVIITSSKMMPTAANVQKTLALLDEGYGFVALYRFGFFGFRKELMRQIGMMDERYLGGWHEDDDYYLRLAEADIAAYITQEVHYNKGPSGWAHGAAIAHYRKKWALTNPGVTTAAELTRTMPEEKYDYDLGPSVPVTFLPASKSYITPAVASTLYYSRINK